MKILLVNDDGIKAEGIWTMARALCKEHEVVIVAPDGQRSGASHSVTLHGALRYTPYENDVCAAYYINGTPCDCVKFGLLELAKGADLVVSGINDCANVGTDILYSGTVNAAIEGAISGLPAIAISVKVKNNDFRFPAQFVADNLELFKSMCRDEVILSINMHSSLREDLKGVRLASCGVRRFDDYYTLKEDGYHLEGDNRFVENDPNSDILLYYNDYIAVAPVKVDYTDREALESWQKAVTSICW